MNPADMPAPQRDPVSSDACTEVSGVEVEELGAWAFDTFFGDLPPDLPDNSDQ